MLTDRQILAKIISAACISNDEIVIEVGTGQGILTAELCKFARQVISYEVDTKLYKKFEEQLLSQFNNLQVLNADLFKSKDVHYFDVFVSNLPYSRSRDAIEWLSTQEKFDRAILMVQQEFADKLLAKPGSKNYRAISTLAAYCFNIEKLFKVRREAFEPQPKVESVVIRIIRINTVTREIIRNINFLFSRRNKKASSAMAFKTGNTKANYGTKRIDELDPKDLVMMAEQISNVHSL
jgi:16S rRNA (adenine1518-N6/adenine1519-N6)-dimethyltransferase